MLCPCTAGFGGAINAAWMVLCFELGERKTGSLLAVDGNGRPRAPG